MPAHASRAGRRPQARAGAGAGREKNWKLTCALATPPCSRPLQAILKDYYFQFFYDDLPIWGYVGKIEKGAPPPARASAAHAAPPSRPRCPLSYPGRPPAGAEGQPDKLLLFTHVHFDISYNEDRVIEINVRRPQIAAPQLASLPCIPWLRPRYLTRWPGAAANTPASPPVLHSQVSTDPAQVADISEGASADAAIEFSYSVAWKATETTYEKRMDKYRKYQFLKQHLEIHWFSIVNSCVTVLLLTGFLATILMRVLRADFVKYSRDDEVRDSCRKEGGESGRNDGVKRSGMEGNGWVGIGWLCGKDGSGGRCEVAQQSSGRQAGCAARAGGTAPRVAPTGASPALPPFFCRRWTTPRSLAGSLCTATCSASPPAAHSSARWSAAARSCWCCRLRSSGWRCWAPSTRTTAAPCSPRSSCSTRSRRVRGGRGGVCVCVWKRSGRK